MKLAPKLHLQLEVFFREFFGDQSLRLPEIEIYAKRGARLITGILGVGGITFGRHIFIQPDLIYRNDQSRLCISKELLAHEAAHTMQYRRLGTLKFLYEYFKSYFLTLRNKRKWDSIARMQAYLDIPFETEARVCGAAFIKWRKNKMQSENGNF